MAPRKPRKTLRERTPIAEWVAAGLGLAITLGLFGYTLVEGLAPEQGPPRLSVTSDEAAVRTDDGYVLPIVVRNASHATAADVEVLGVLEPGGQASQERRHARFTYVPGRGEVHGGLVFQSDPRSADVQLSVEGYADP